MIGIEQRKFTSHRSVNLELSEIVLSDVAVTVMARLFQMQYLTSGNRKWGHCIYNAHHQGRLSHGT